MDIVLDVKKAFGAIIRIFSYFVADLFIYVINSWWYKVYWHSATILQSDLNSNFWPKYGTSYVLFYMISKDDSKYVVSCIARMSFSIWYIHYFISIFYVSMCWIRIVNMLGFIYTATSRWINRYVKCLWSVETVSFYN